VEALTREVDMILVVGSANSSNSNRLVEVARSSKEESGPQTFERTGNGLHARQLERWK